MQKQSVTGKEEVATETVSLRRKISFAVIAVILASIFGIAVMEGVLVLADAQVSLFPRWEYSSEYGLVLPKDARMVHRKPGRWKFVYSINKHGFRGDPIPISGSYEKKNVVILGDSYSMGVGVDDGEEYPAIMAAGMKDGFKVINLAVGGWGLTQQTRIFFEFGQLYKPDIVILQHCVNDPGDNLCDRVTEVKSGRLVFRDTDRRSRRFQTFISHSRIIQNSQLYSFLRKQREIWKAGRHPAAVPTQALDSLPAEETLEERYYNELLEAFAVELDSRGITLLMISVNGQLNRHPHIRDMVQQLESRGLIRYLEVEDWLSGETGYESPEGHEWGVNAHRIIGNSLAEYIRTELQSKSAGMRAEGELIEDRGWRIEDRN